MNHLDILNLRLSNERIRLNNAKTDDERKLRSVWVKQMEKEIKKEIEFLESKDEISIDELFEIFSK